MLRMNSKIAMLVVALILLVGVIPPAWAQTGFPALTATGTLTAASSSCLSTNCVTLAVTAETGAVAWQLTGTFVATTQFEGSVDGTTWISMAVSPPNTAGLRVISTTAAGVWQANTAGLKTVRVRVSGYSSGSVVVTGRRSSVPAPFGVAQ